MATAFKPCSVPGCNGNAAARGVARGFCWSHYRRWQRHSDPLSGGDKRQRHGPICSLDGCGKAVHARGWCSAHYERWLEHGDPLGGGSSWGAPKAFLEASLVNDDGGRCIIWPYGRNSNGYGQITLNGKKLLAPRIVCERIHGPAPSPKHQAAHSCGNGHLGCINPKHLRWATPQENQMDRVDHGTHNRGERQGQAKLTEDDVHQILALRGTMTQRATAEMFEVSQSAVSAIYSGRNWAWLSDGDEHK